MTTEWIELKTGKEVFDRAANWWEIEVGPEYGPWRKWIGRSWSQECHYRGRPPQPKTKVVTSECWRNKEHGDLTWRSPDYGGLRDDWQRFPAGDITGEVSDE